MIVASGMTSLIATWEMLNHKKKILMHYRANSAYAAFRDENVALDIEPDAERVHS